MRADTWSDVWDAAVVLGESAWSRLKNLSANEQRRRAEADAKRQAGIDALFAQVREEDEDDDEAHVEAWMQEHGFTSNVRSRGVSEQMEVAITTETEAFRQRLAEIIGNDDFSFYVNVGLDSEDDSE